jgi:hypothetical protein
MRTRLVTVLTLALGVAVVLGIGLPATGHATGTNLIISNGSSSSPAVSSAAPDLQDYPGPGCMGCFFCPAGEGPFCRAAFFTSDDDQIGQLLSFFGDTCVPAGCGGAFAALGCDPATLQFVHDIYDPTFNPVACAAQVAARPAPTLSRFGLAGLSILMLGIGAFGLLRRATR